MAQGRDFDDVLARLLSQRARIVGPSVWAAAQPDPRPVISFAGGLPDIPSLPAVELERAVHRVLERERKEALEYGGTYGPLPLRLAVAERSGRLEGLPLSPDQVVISSGSAQGIGNLCEVLIDIGDVVLCESPNFPGSLRTFRSFGAELVAIPMDEEGLRVDLMERELERLAAEGRRPKLLYTIPSHQNPAGCTMSLERRQRVVELAKSWEFLIVEDDAYGELWFEEPPPPSLFALAGGSHVAKVCSFSKIIATGLRLGWTLAPPSLAARLAAIRYDMGTSPFLGRVVAEMIRSGDLDRHVERLRAIYRRKLERMEEALQRYCAPYCHWQRPRGGFFLWVALREGIDAREVAIEANQRGVLVGAGAAFFADGRPTNHLRLAFSYVDYEDIEEGVRRLSEAIAAVAARSGAG